jgi:hypothetical protein
MEEYWRWAMTCPHCGTYSSIRPRNWIPGEKPYIASCVRCGGWVFLLLSGEPDELELVDYFPKYVPRVEEGVPKTVALGFIEAAKCFDAEAFCACATMCRRVVQAVVVDMGGKGKTLNEQINSLADSHVITPSLCGWAHEVRVIGVAGAHADVANDVGKADAHDALEFTRSLLEHVYVMPAMIARRRRESPPGKDTRES